MASAAEAGQLAGESAGPTWLGPTAQTELLRFTTAGSVDDGKSTLIGRLLYDSKGVYEDQLASVRKATRNLTTDGLDLSLLTDGLRAEREQGITIDVAYRYFATPRRKFIIADTPGHEQYTRNMATGASTANLAIVLIDARPNRRRLAKIEWRSCNAPQLAGGNQPRIHRSKFVRLNHQHMLQDVAAVRVQIEIGVIRQVQDRLLVRGGGVIDFQFVAVRQRVSDLDI